jgi:hypothetical protein
MVECGACRAPVAAEDARLPMLGLDRHTCTNPAGVTFVVACFADAPGVRAVSNESSEWSWFPGYRWQLVACRRCGVHLGWRYVRKDGSFYGLIEDRLRAGTGGERSDS